MRAAIRLILAVVFCVAIAAGVVVWATGGLDWWRNSRSAGGPSAGNEAETDPEVTWYADPTAAGRGSRLFVDSRELDRYLGTNSFAYKAPLRDAASLGELRDAVRMRGQRGIITLRGKYDALNMGALPGADKLAKAIPVVRDLAFFYMHEGEFDQAASWLDRGLEMSRGLWYGEKLQREFHVLLGINALRRGEIENCLDCVGPSSCIFPIAREAVHRQQAGSREAVERFTAYLRRVARRPARPLAAEHRLHDAGRVPRQGPAAIT